MMMIKMNRMRLVMRTRQVHRNSITYIYRTIHKAQGTEKR